MATGLAGADVESALEGVSVPSYCIDTEGIVRWTNPAARRLVGDVVGRQFTSVIAPQDVRRARELFARKIAGKAEVTDAEVVLVGEARHERRDRRVGRRLDDHGHRDETQQALVHGGYGLKGPGPGGS